tara:strand:- start:11500 stop:13359 length:1860 start_codon:yes stop_codon:yes gene_type:complete
MRTYAQAQGDLEPSYHHSVIFQIINSSLPEVHFFSSEVKSDIEKRLAVSLIKKMNFMDIVYSGQDISEVMLQKTHIESALMSGNVSELFGLVESLHDKKIARLQRMKALLSEVSADEVLTASVYSEDRLRNKIQTPLNEAHRDLVVKKVLISKVSHHIASGKSFEEAKGLVLTTVHEEILIESNNDNGEHFFEIIMNALLGSYGPYSKYIAPSDIDKIKSSYANKNYRVGLDLKLDDGYIVVSGVVKGSPAELNSQFRVGDKIVSVKHNDEVYDMTHNTPRYLGELVSGFSSKKSPIVFTIDRHGQLLTFSLFKGLIDKLPAELETYKSPLHQNSSYYLAIPSFYSGISDEVFTAVNKAHGEDVIIDLRDNGGGSLLEAIKISSLFLSGEELLITKDVGGSRVFRDEDDVTLTNKLIILVNRNTASAAEVVASTLQFYGRAVIVGESTFGKGTIQRFVDFANSDFAPLIGNINAGGALITIAGYYKPDGISIHGTGVTPDLTLQYWRNNAEFVTLPPIRDAKKHITMKGDEWREQLIRDMHLHLNNNPLYKYSINNLPSLKIKKEKISTADLIEAHHQQRERERIYDDWLNKVTKIHAGKELEVSFDPLIDLVSLCLND